MSIYKAPVIKTKLKNGKYYKPVSTVTNGKGMYITKYTEEKPERIYVAIYQSGTRDSFVSETIFASSDIKACRKAIKQYVIPEWVSKDKPMAFLYLFVDGIKKKTINVPVKRLKQ